MEMYSCAHSAGTLAHESDIVWIAAKAADVLLQPQERCSLVAKAVVWQIAGLLHFCGVEESWCTNSIAANC
jgi:hypothetical protein